MNRWKEIIEESCSFPCKIPRENIEECAKFFQKTKKRFKKFKISCSFSEDDRILAILEGNGSECVELVLDGCLWSMDFFVDILKCLPNLKQLKLFETHVHYEADVKVFELIQLKILQMFMSSGRGILESLVAPNLETIQLDDFIPYTHAVPEHIKDFLKSKKNLKTLVIDSTVGYIDHLSKLLDGSMPFQLTHLSFNNNYHGLSENSFLKFMETQAATVNSLELHGPFNIHVYKLIFSTFTNLKSLSLHIGNLPKRISFYEELKKMKSVKKLSLRSGFIFEYDLCFEAFIRCLPNITELKLCGDCDNKTIQFISSSLLNLEKLSIKHFVDFSDVQLPMHLHSLKIEELNIDKQLHWDKFTKNFSQITELFVNSISKIDRNIDDPINFIRMFVKSLKSFKLQVLKIGKDFPFIEELVDILHESHSVAEILDLDESMALKMQYNLNSFSVLRYRKYKYCGYCKFQNWISHQRFIYCFCHKIDFEI